MSIFSVSLESADTNEVHTTANMNNDGLIQAALEEYLDVEHQRNIVEKLEEGSDKVSDIKDAISDAMESGLSQQAYTILQASLRNIIGKRLTAKNTISLEAAEKENKYDLVRLALEGIKETVSQFWNAIKTQVTKFWNMTKQWYIKNLDVANKLISRGKALSEKANTLTTAPTEKTFSLAGASLLSVNRQNKDPNVLITALETLKLLGDTVLINVEKRNQNDLSDRTLTAAQKALKLVRDRQSVNIDNDKEINEAIKAIFISDIPEYKPVVGDQTYKNQDIVKKLGLDPASQSYYVSKPLPGDKSFYIISPDDTNESVNDPIAYFKSIRYTIADTDGKTIESESEKDVPTLNSSQIAKIADTVTDIGEAMLKYKKEFEARDKYFSKITKGFDSIIKELEGTALPTQAHESADNQSAPQQQPQQQSQQSTTTQQQQQPAANQQTQATDQSKEIDAADKFIRKYAQAILSLFKKNISLSGSIVNFQVKTCSMALTYCERSAALYGK